ncbi:MAG: hypothetical protein AAFU53_15605 [Cyanobacteria bacterium J06632_3]
MTKRSFAATLAALISLGIFGAGQPAEATPSETFVTEGAYCEYYPKGSVGAIASMPCSFIQDERQVDILWADGVYSQFEQIRSLHDGTLTGLYVDRRGGIVQQLETGTTHNHHFEMEAGSLYVYVR